MQNSHHTRIYKSSEGSDLAPIDGIAVVYLFLPLGAIAISISNILMLT